MPPRLGALRHRDFRLYWLGQTISRAGSEINFVAKSWQLYELTHSPVNLGLLGLFRVLPVMILAIGAGVVADAFDRRRLMMITQSILAISSAALAVLAVTGRATPAALYGLTFLSSCALAFDNPARNALVPGLVPADDLPNALSLNVTTFQLAGVVGPGIGGIIIGIGDHGVVLAYIVDALSFLVVVVSLFFIKPPPARAVRTEISLRAALEGLTFVRKQVIIRWMMLVDFVGTFFAGALLLMPIFADQVLHVGKRGLGALLAADAVGALVAAVIMSWTRPIQRRGAFVLASIAIYGLAVTGFGLSTNIYLTLFFLAVSGAADTVSTVIRQTVRQLLTPDELRGRMTSVNMIFFMGGPQLGEVEAGLVARAVGAPLSVAMGGLLCAGFAIGVAAAVPEVREHRA